MASQDVCSVQWCVLTADLIDKSKRKQKVESKWFG